MSSVCSDQHINKLLSPKKSVDIPPRKLLTRRAALHDGDMFSDDTSFQKFLPCNSGGDSDSDSDGDDPYSSDHFRMYEFKVRRCTRSRSHDWTDCPFAHPGEKARRRDPRRFHYSGTVCTEYRRSGACGRGDNCDFAHGVFECWLHPARYRTEACKDGKNCRRKVCFFAHTPKQLRILPVTLNSPSNDAALATATAAASCKKNKVLSNNCCLFCHHCGGGGGGAAAAANSPTSTLFGMSRFSPPLSPSSSGTSPPVSPAKKVSPMSRYGARHHGGLSSNSNGMNYEEVVSELMSSLEVLNFSDGWGVPSSAVAKAASLPWVDVSLGCEDQQQQQQLAFSPTNNTLSMMSPTSYYGDHKYSSSFFSNDNMTVANNNVANGGGGCGDVNGSNCPAPDLGWVNDLLM